MAQWFRHIHRSGAGKPPPKVEIALPIAVQIRPSEANSPTDPEAGRAQCRVSGMKNAVCNMIDADLRSEDVTDMTERYGPRLNEPAIELFTFRAFRIMEERIATLQNASVS